ncbi:PREDICTED: lipase maturation factor 2, partial [Aptenodytes forsteri]|uniref:lipase maturation factor 2 n=1 Tax=Aptenodytes forsteri TaxID=9233 RepID=UPI0004F47F33
MPRRRRGLSLPLVAMPWAQLKPPGNGDVRGRGGFVPAVTVPFPGLYGRDGILPARKVLRLSGKGLWEQLRDFPTLLWLSPRLGLDTEMGMELLCLLGVLASFGALLFEPLRDSLLFALLRVLYLSLYQPRIRPPEPFALAAGAGGFVRRSSALTYHYETQCIPTPGAWFAHQLPVWFQKFSVVATYVIEIAVPLLFFAPIRRLRLFAFYSQVLLQVLIILTGNYNFFNMLTIVLAFSLLDEEHVGRWLGRSKRRHTSRMCSERCPLALSLPGLSGHGSHPSVQRCACVRGCFWKLWATLQWAIFATATVGMFAISLVPFTYIDYESNGKLWPGIHQMFNAVERFQVVNSYGLFRRMTGVGGRPEVVLEGSYDKQTWTEVEFMYKIPAGANAVSPAVIRLVQVDESRYPFSAQPPVYIRAQLYKYWFTGSAEG